MDRPASIESLAREVQVLRDRLTISEARAEASASAQRHALEQAKDWRDKLALAEGREKAAADEVARHIRTINTLIGPDSSHERMRQVLLWLDRRGGLGFHVHESIQSALRGSEVSRG